MRPRLSDIERKGRKKLYRDRYNKKHPEKRKQYSKEYYLRHRKEILKKEAEERKLVGSHKWSREWFKDYKEKHPEKYQNLNKKKRRYAQNQIDNITDQYVIRLLRDNYKIKGVIPPEFIQMYKIQIKVKRTLKQKKNGNESIKTS